MLNVGRILHYSGAGHDSGVSAGSGGGGKHCVARPIFSLVTIYLLDASHRRAMTIWLGTLLDICLAVVGYLAWLT